MNDKIKKFICLFVLSFIIFNSGHICLTQENNVWNEIEAEKKINFDPALNQTDDNLGSITQLTLDDETPAGVVVFVIRMCTTLLGLVFLILIIYAGFIWMTAQGNEEQITKAKKILIRSIIGLTIVLLSYSIAYLIYYIIGVNATDVEANWGLY